MNRLRSQRAWGWPARVCQRKARKGNERIGDRERTTRLVDLRVLGEITNSVGNLAGRHERGSARNGRYVAWTYSRLLARRTRLGGLLAGGPIKPSRAAQSRHVGNGS